MGEREDLKELEEKKSYFVSIMRDCWCSDPCERINLMLLRDRIGNVGYDDDDFDGEYEADE
jgi:hypothetical protein